MTRRLCSIIIGCCIAGCSSGPSSSGTGGGSGGESGGSEGGGAGGGSGTGGGVATAAPSTATRFATITTATCDTSFSIAANSQSVYVGCGRGTGQQFTGGIFRYQRPTPTNPTTVPAPTMILSGTAAQQNTVGVMGANEEGLFFGQAPSPTTVRFRAETGTVTTIGRLGSANAAGAPRAIGDNVYMMYSDQTFSLDVFPAPSVGYGKWSASGSGACQPGGFGGDRDHAYAYAICDGGTVVRLLGATHPAVGNNATFGVVTSGPHSGGSGASSGFIVGGEFISRAGLNIMASRIDGGVPPRLVGGPIMSNDLRDVSQSYIWSEGGNGTVGFQLRRIALSDATDTLFRTRGVTNGNAYDVSGAAVFWIENEGIPNEVGLFWQAAE